MRSDDGNSEHNIPKTIKVIDTSSINNDLNNGIVGYVKPKKHRKLLYLSTFIFFLMLAAGLFYYFLFIKDKNTLPLPISRQTVKSLQFDIYYPNKKMLPSSYVLNTSSFSYSEQTLIYTVTGGLSKIIFSNQLKPDNAQIQQFYATKMPLHTTLNTSIGTATIGSINGQTIVSIPTNTNTWVIMTAPQTVNQQDLSQIINSIEIAN
jgi:hypothetical protein